MLLMLATISAVILALAAVASAQEIHFDTATAFTGTGGGASLRAKGEPTLTFESLDIDNGTISAGGTTGSMTLDFTGCHITVFGLTAKCHTKESALDNTVAVGATFHLITWKNAQGTVFPAILLTVGTFEIITAGSSNLHFEGNVIGTNTSPACGASSNKLTLSFTATANASGDVTQDHEVYTGSVYDLVARTGGGGGSPITAGLTAEATLTANQAGTLTCT